MACRCEALSRSVGRGLLPSLCEACLHRAAADRRRIRAKMRREQALETRMDSSRKVPGRTGVDRQATDTDVRENTPCDLAAEEEILSELRPNAWEVGAVPAGVADRVFKGCSDKLSSNYMEERICCVCDGLYPYRDMVTRGVARCKALVKAMQQLEYGRKLGNEYVNAHVPVISNTLKCNHDVKLLAAGEGPHKGFYMMKYCVKPQNDIENPAALHLHAYDKATTNAQDLADACNTGRKRIQSMCCTLSNGQEVAAPMEALYLQRESPFYASHEFAPLHLDSIVGVLFNGEEDTVVLEQVREGTYKPASVLMDYCCRPTTMGNICLMEFKRHWEKKRDTKGELFQKPHPQYSTHSIHCLPTEAVVTVFSSRLPDIRRSNVNNEVKLYYCKRFLALFMPFRLPSGFDVVDERVVFKFDAWWRTPEADLARRYANFSEDYYVSRDVADARADDDIVHYEHCTTRESRVMENDNSGSP